ncbi:MAG: DedA family protein [Candidatus Doudnabacteria bacterium]
MWYTLSDVIRWLIHFKYWVIFPFAVFEGPIVTIITGFLASTGQLNFWVAFMVVALGDLVGDTFYYCVGRFGRERFIARFGKFFGLNKARIERLELHFQTHPWKTFTFGKFFHGTGSLILAAAGLSRVPYFEFLGYNVPTTFANSFILITIGYYFGHAYAQIDTFFKYFSVIVIALVVAAYIYFIKRYSNIPD